MGNPLSPLAAELFLDDLENKFIMSPKNPFIDSIVYWFRYVDDILCLFSGDRAKLFGFYNYINSVHDSIKFTVELEENNRLNFLDLRIIKQNNRHEFGIFRKPSSTDTILHRNSFHHPRQKMAVFHNLFYRLLNLPLQEEESDKEFNYILHLARVNGFSEDEAIQIFERQEKKKILSQLFPAINSNEGKWIGLPFIGELSMKIERVLKRFDFKVGFKSSFSLRQLLSKPKDVIPDENKCGVYKLVCGTCEISYVGQCGRRFHKRMGEHFSRSDSKFFKHINTENHIQAQHMVSFVHFKAKSKILNALEGIEIFRARQLGECLNKRREGGTVSVVYCPFPTVSR